MHKVLKLSALVLIGIFMYANANAGVSFIVESQNGSRGSNSHSNTNNRPKPTSNTCLKKGYVMTHCPSGSFGGDVCPDNSSYFKKCCNANTYRFSSFSECAQYGKMPGNECGGRYSCN